MYYTKIVVQYSNGTKAKGVRVALSISGIFSGGRSKSVLTDRNGVAIISHESKGRAKVLVKNIARGSEIICPSETVVFI